MWERGLKQPDRCQDCPLLGVAPHVGAWIETCLRLCLYRELKSLPMWERGLKPTYE